MFRLPEYLWIAAMWSSMRVLLRWLAGLLVAPVRIEDVDTGEKNYGSKFDPNIVNIVNITPE